MYCRQTLSCLSPQRGWRQRLSETQGENAVCWMSARPVSQTLPGFTQENGDASVSTFQHGMGSIDLNLKCPQTCLSRSISGRTPVAQLAHSILSSSLLPMLPPPLQPTPPSQTVHRCGLFLQLWPLGSEEPGPCSARLRALGLPPPPGRKPSGQAASCLALRSNTVHTAGAQ